MVRVRLRVYGMNVSESSVLKSIVNSPVFVFLSHTNCQCVFKVILTF